MSVVFLIMLTLSFPDHWLLSTSLKFHFGAHYTCSNFVRVTKCFQLFLRIFLLLDDYCSQQQQPKSIGFVVRGPNFKHATIMRTRLSNQSDFRHCLATSLCISDKSVLRSIPKLWNQSEVS